MVAKHVYVDSNGRRGKGKHAHKHGTEVSWCTRHLRLKDWHTSTLGYLITALLAFEHRTSCMRPTYFIRNDLEMQLSPARATGTTDKWTHGNHKASVIDG